MLAICLLVLVVYTIEKIDKEIFKLYYNDSKIVMDEKTLEKLEKLEILKSGKIIYSRNLGEFPISKL